MGSLVLAPAGAGASSLVQCAPIPAKRINAAGPGRFSARLRMRTLASGPAAAGCSVEVWGWEEATDMVQCKKVVYVCLRYPMMGQRRATGVCTMPRALAVLRRTWGCWRLGLRSGFRGKSRRKCLQGVQPCAHFQRSSCAVLARKRRRNVQSQHLHEKPSIQTTRKAQANRAHPLTSSGPVHDGLYNSRTAPPPRGGQTPTAKSLQTLVCRLWEARPSCLGEGLFKVSDDADSKYALPLGTGSAQYYGIQAIHTDFKAAATRQDRIENVGFIGLL